MLHFFVMQHEQMNLQTKLKCLTKTTEVRGRIKGLKGWKSSVLFILIWSRIELSPCSYFFIYFIINFLNDYISRTQLPNKSNSLRSSAQPWNHCFAHKTFRQGGGPIDKWAGWSRYGSASQTAQYSSYIAQFYDEELQKGPSFGCCGWTELFCCWLFIAKKALAYNCNFSFSNFQLGLPLCRS